MKLWREVGWWILAAVILVFFWRPLTTETFCYRDLHLLFYPKKVFLVKALASGHLPLWDPFTHSGQPYLASPANTIFYPANLLYAILSPLAAFNLILVLQTVFCGWAAYALARVLNLSQPAAFVSGAFYALCGYTLSSANLMPILLALPWVPLTLALVHLYVTNRRPRYLVSAAITATLPLFAGGAEVTGILFTTIAVWLVFVTREAPLRERAKALGFVLLFAVGLSLAQTIPAAEMIRQSSRFDRRPYDDFARWSVSPRRLPELAIPRFFGATDVPDESFYWGGKFEWRFPYILSIYCGIVALVLVVSAVVAPARDASERRIIRVLFALALAGLIFSLGRNLPLFRQLYEILPGINNFRYPIKAMMISLVPIALLAGYGAERVEARSRIVAVVSGATSIVLLTLFASYALSPGFRSAFESAMFTMTLNARAQSELTGCLLHSAAFATLLSLIVILSRNRSWPVSPAIAALVFFDLTIGGSRVNIYAPRSVFDRPPIADAASAIIRDGRLYRDPTEVEKYQLFTPDPGWVMWWQIQTLKSYIGALFDIPMALHTDYDGLAPWRMATLMLIGESKPMPARLPLFTRAGVTAIITRENLPLDRALTIRDSDGQPLHLYANPQARGIRFASKARYAASEQEAVNAVFAAPVNQDEVILLGGGPPPARDCKSSVTLISRSLNETNVSVDTSCDGFVVFSETYYPGWKIYVDGQPGRMLRADFAMSAVAVSRGRHTIRKVYRPVAVPIGFAGSALSIAGLIVVARRMKQ